ncbi:glycosyltransferase family 9 protein [Halobacteriovorax sp. GFR7]|uniref:glycosyltransferase family 9 protein n=1 Tax=unclassified Halobacteriovorax TaxID=2639665 RepID=UPI003721D470
MKYLISRTDAIGQNILTMPMAQAIKEMDPNATVAIITSPTSVILYKDHPYIDKVYVLDKKRSYPFKVKRALQVFNDFKPDVYLYAGGSQTPNFVAWLKKVPFRGGHLAKWQANFTLNRGVRQIRSEVEGHETFYNIELLRDLDNFITIEDKEYIPEFNFNVNENDFNSFKELIKGEGLDPEKEMVFVHPGVSNNNLPWPAKNIATFIKRINGIYPNRFNFIISHIPSDLRYVNPVRDELRDYNDQNIYYFNGKKRGIVNFLNILKHATLFIGPNSGATHMAAALGVALIGIYSPIKSHSSLRWKPKGETEIKTVTPNVVCGESDKCAGMDCPYYDCMAKIEEDRVIEIAKSILNK